MADAETLTEIIELVVGMVDAAPGADILAELEAAVDGGATVEDIAIAIAANPAWSGDTGLFPDFLPNAIFAMQWLTQLMGDSVDEDTLQEAIDELTATLNNGTGRGEAMYATVVALSETTDPDLADAAATLANKTAVAEYYSIDVAQSSEELDDLIGVLDGVDETDDSVDTATDAVDDEIAANASLVDLLVALDAAEEALADAEEAAGGTEAEIDALISMTIDPAIDALGSAAGDWAAGAYTAGSEGVKAALVADKQVADATALAGLNTTLATETDDVDDITGLASAIAVFEAAVDAKTAADEAAALAANALTEAESNYEALSGETLAALGGPTYATTGAVDLIVATVPAGSYELDTGITEAGQPGVEALLAANLASIAAALAAAAADAAVEDALDQVENLDPGAGAPTTTLAAVGADMAANVGNLIDPADAAAPTLAEIDAQQTALDAGIAQLVADIAALATAGTSGVEATDEAAHAALTAAAVTAGFIDATTQTMMDAAFDAAADGSQGGLDTAATMSDAVVDADNLALDFDALVTAYTMTGNGAQTVAAATAPNADAFIVARTAVEAQEDLIDDLAELLADREESLAGSDGLDDLGDAVTDAVAAFGDAGFEAPVDLDSAVKAATVDDDVFVVDDQDSQIISFGGDDVLYVGPGYVLNTGDVDEDGDDTVLEVFIDGSDVIVETSVFGSSAAVQEVVTITLTGVSEDDIMFADGFITVG